MDSGGVSSVPTIKSAKVPSFRKYLLINALGFGLAGAIWGAARFFLVPVSATTIDFPLHYILVFSISILGGLSLTYGIGNLKHAGRVIGFGFLGSVPSLLAGALSEFYLFSLGDSLLPWTRFESGSFFWADFSNLEPNIMVGNLWITFLIMGAIIGIFFALGLKIKIWTMAWRAGVGMALGSIIGPVLGNLVDPLWLSYLVTFSIITALMGVAIAWKGYSHGSFSSEK